LKRDAARREILVFTEGEKTEDGYLLPWRRAYRESVLLTVESSSTHDRRFRVLPVSPPLKHG